MVGKVQEADVDEDEQVREFRERSISRGDAEADGDDDDDDDDDDEAEVIVYRPSEEHVLEGLEEEAWSIDHVKLLYMLSLYSKAAENEEDQEHWMRQVPLLVMMYEAVTAGVLDFDYAPASMIVSHNGVSRRLWVNITQEGKSAVDDLRESKLLNALKLTTEDFMPVTAYQVSARGEELLTLCPDDLKSEVHGVVYPKTAKAHDPMNILNCSFDAEEGHFQLANRLKGEDRFSRISAVTEAEDVSYVCSPYMPSCLRERDPKPLTSNASRSHESAAGSCNIQDELDEAIVLGGVRCCVGEYIPFGANQIVALNERLGALDRCQGGFFTNMVDENPTDTSFDVPPGLTQVKVLDYNFVNFINFEAEINYAEEAGIIQIEHFGMHLHAEGNVVYGIAIEAILDRDATDISVDHLARLLVDIHQDSSRIMNDLLSKYQAGCLDMIFCGDMDNRGKFNLIICETITPFLPASKYIDKSDRENELKQVLGDISESYRLGANELLLLGREGMLYAGPASGRHEAVLMNYLFILNIEKFVRNFFQRMFILDDVIEKIRELIDHYRHDPHNIVKYREMLNESHHTIILLDECMEYVKRSLERLKIVRRPMDEAGDRLYVVLNMNQLKKDIMLRVTDLSKLVHGSGQKLEILQLFSTSVTKQLLEKTVIMINDNCRGLVDASKAEERSAIAADIMNLIFGGSFVFDFIDRTSGDDMLGGNGVDSGTKPWFSPEEEESRNVDWVNQAFRNTMAIYPGLWFFVNCVFLFFILYLMQRFMGYLLSKTLGAASARFKLNIKVDREKWMAYLETKKMIATDMDFNTSQMVMKAAWGETDKKMWGGEPPVMAVVYDDKIKFLLSILVNWNSFRLPLDKLQVLDIWEKDLIR